MPLRCIAIDDEPLALELIRQFVSRFPELALEQSFTDAIAGMAYLKTHAADLLFVDINMPDINGTELVRKLAQRPMVIFTTAYQQFALEGFELDAIDYLVKPLSFERFTKAVQKAIELFQLKNAARPETPDALIVRSEYQLVRIEWSDIEYIESVEDYLKIHRGSGKPVMTLMTVKALMEKLPAGQFIRIHRSYVIPLSKVKSIANRKVRLTQAELPISDSYAGFIRDWKKRK